MTSFFVRAIIILPDAISDNMVLQQKTNIKLWGGAKINANVKVTPSWLSLAFYCKADQNGKWQLFIPTPAASFQKHTITISDGKSITIKNVLVGEVWLCSGQSNMEMTLSGYTNQPISDADYFVANAKSESGIRMFNVIKSADIKSAKIGKGNWMESSPQNLPKFSATAYFFALRLNEILNMPIGIINASYGGSSIEGWLYPATVEKYNDFDFKKNIDDSMSWLRPYVMYQNMLKPFGNYVINGFTWYQGESNVGRYGSYAQKLQDLVYLWRYTFNNPTLPFYAVEIAPFNYGLGDDAAKLREAQLEGMQALNNTGLICTNDLVAESEATNIHPSQKKPIGDRLANLVLHDVYFCDSISANSPIISQVTITNDSIVLLFKNVYEGLQNQNEFVGLEVADSTRNFRPIKAILGLNRNTLIIKLEPGFLPVSVRYCFKNFQIGNIKNSEGLPLVPFRTDDWGN